MTDRNAERLDRESNSLIGPLDPRQAQNRIVAAFGDDEEEASSSASDQSDPDDGSHAPGENPEEGSNVVPLSDDDGQQLVENPFAKEAKEALALRQLEALLFASPEPLSIAFLIERLPGADTLDVTSLLETLARHYEHRGVTLRQVNEKWQFVTATDMADVLVEHRSQERKLSRAALETLAIIAYHQPCSRADIEEVRGVAVAKGSLDQLLELGWVKIKGRREVPGRPLLYGTSPAFLEHFGLESLGHLPGMADLKAAGLLEARLPPGFAVPMPKDEDAETMDPQDLLADGEDPEFASEFIDEDSLPVAEGQDLEVEASDSAADMDELDD
ncbi:MAG: SMC-Scp complex subunit ScpB [Pseudomonadota bacterium]